jgi:hypothetical protein
MEWFVKINHTRIPSWWYPQQPLEVRLLPRRRKRTVHTVAPRAQARRGELVDGRVRDDDATCWSSGEGGCTSEDTEGRTIWKSMGSVSRTRHSLPKASSLTVSPSRHLSPVRLKSPMRPTLSAKCVWPCSIKTETKSHRSSA